jgi:hypothetical protein
VGFPSVRTGIRIRLNQTCRPPVVSTRALPATALECPNLSLRRRRRWKRSRRLRRWVLLMRLRTRWTTDLRLQRLLPACSSSRLVRRRRPKSREPSRGPGTMAGYSSHQAVDLRDSTLAYRIPRLAVGSHREEAADITAPRARRQRREGYRTPLRRNCRTFTGRRRPIPSRRSLTTRLRLRAAYLPVGSG